MPSANAVLEIDVVSDVVCPWCYVGKRRLESALASLAAREPALRTVVRWQPFELNPDLPREGVDRRRYLEAKFGGEARVAGINERVRSAGESAGLALSLDRIAVQPNTRDAHRLIAWAQSQGDAGPLVERLFAAHFVEGRAVGDLDTLAALAGEAGLDAAAARTLLAGTGLREDVEAMERRAREIGVSGVPFFIFAGRVAVSGAHEPETMLQAIAQARDAAGRPAGAP